MKEHNAANPALAHAARLRTAGQAEEHILYMFEALCCGSAPSTNNPVRKPKLKVKYCTELTLFAVSVLLLPTIPLRRPRWQPLSTSSGALCSSRVCWWDQALTQGVICRDEDVYGVDLTCAQERRTYKPTRFPGKNMVLPLLATFKRLVYDIPNSLSSLWQTIA